MKEGLLSKVPNKVDSNILAVYSDYESDANGAYTFLLGARVSSTDNVPSGMVAKKVPAGRYAVFTSEKGFVGKVVPETWSRIWAVPKSAPGGNRAYQADFEAYDQRAADPQNAQVDIYVGIKYSVPKKAQSTERPSITLSIARCCFKIVLPEPRRRSGKMPRGNRKTCA